jgi:hypothetical protein
LIDAQPTEEAQLNDAALPSVLAGQPQEGIIESQDIKIEAHHYCRLEGQSFLSRATLASPPAARVIDEDAAHHLGSQGEEVGTTLQITPTLTHKAQVGLVHQRCRLQGVIGPLVSQMAGRQATQFRIHARQQLVQRRPIAAAPR